MKVYIAGPMRGYADFNFPAFHAAAARLRELGCTVISPAEIDTAFGFDPSQDVTSEMMRDFVRRDVQALTEVDVVALLDGWLYSTGACAEVAVAKWLGLEAVPIDELVASLGGARP